MSAANNASNSLLPTHIAGYSLRSVSQQTAFSTSYIGVDEASQEQVLVIIYNLPANEANIQKAKDLAAAPLDSILPIYDAGAADGFLYISCQYLEGKSLDSLIAEKMTLNDAQSTISTIANALNQLHSQGIVHGNLNPSCIHFDNSGKVFLSHFQIQSGSSQQLQAVGEQTDNVSFSAPESIKSELATAATDYYSFGLIAYSALTGNIAFQAESAYQTALLQLQSRLPTLEGIPNNLQQLITQCCKKSPTLRPQDLLLASSNSANDVIQNQDTTPSLSSDSTHGLSVDAGDRRSKAAKNTAKTNTAIPNNSKVPLIIAASAIFLLGFSGAVYVSPQHASLAPLVPIHEAIVNMLDPSQAEIKSLLAKGQTQINTEAYFDAAKTYHQVLTIDASQAEAIDKINWLVQHYLDQAFTSINANDFAAADIHINHALDIDEKHASIPPARTLYDERLAAKLAGDADAVAQLEAQLEAQRLADELAAKTSADAEKLKAENDAALAEKQRLAASAAAKAKADAKAKAEALAKEKAEALAKAEADKAAQLVEQERLLKAKQAAALARAAEIQADLNRRNQLMSKVKIQGLLKKAETYFARGEYRSPAQENALEKYQEVLALDSNNNSALDGIDRTVSAIIPELAQLFNNEQFSQGKLLFDQLKAASPNNEDLNIFAGAQGL